MEACGAGWHRIAVLAPGGGGMGSGATCRLGRSGYRAATSSLHAGEAFAPEPGGHCAIRSHQQGEDFKRLADGVVRRGRAAMPSHRNWRPRAGGSGSRSGRAGPTAAGVCCLHRLRRTGRVSCHTQRQFGGVIAGRSPLAATQPDPACKTSGVFGTGLAAFGNPSADRHAAKGSRMTRAFRGLFDPAIGSSARAAMARCAREDELSASIAVLDPDGAGRIAGQRARADGGSSNGLTCND